MLDSGGSATLVKKDLTKKLKVVKGNDTTVWTTPAGEMRTNKECTAQFTIPELHDDRVIQWQCHVHDNLGGYDMILGRDILRELKIDIQFSDDTIHWDEASIPMKDRDCTVQDSFFIKDPKAVDFSMTRIKQILDAKYEKANLEEIAKDCFHLTQIEQQLLLKLLKKYEPLFDGTLGTWKGSAYDIELKEGVKPYHAIPFPIPKIHMETLKHEVQCLVKAGVLRKVNHSEWAAPTFIIPKKDGTVRFISDFRELNKRIKRKPYPIPRIQDLLLKLEGFQHATSLDLNMGYYHIELTPFSKQLCTIVLPFGKYEYQRLPMGLCNSPDIFQEKVSELMDGLEFVRAYIDDILITMSTTFEDHLIKLEQVFKRLKQAGLKVNAKKSFFGKPEIEYLGYWITRYGIQPVAKKVQALLTVAEPKSKKELRRFIGMVNYYRDMWIRRSHVLAPLTRLTSKEVKWEWTQKEQDSYHTMK